MATRTLGKGDIDLLYDKLVAELPDDADDGYVETYTEALQDFHREAVMTMNATEGE